MMEPGILDSISLVLERNREVSNERDRKVGDGRSVDCIGDKMRKKGGKEAMMRI